MSLSYKDVAQSKPFRLLIGWEKVEFFVHQSLIGHLSRPLDTLVHGQMKEAKEGCACIDDVDTDTFARVVEYMYTRDYPAAEHLIVLDASSIANEGQEQHGPDPSAGTVEGDEENNRQVFQIEIEPEVGMVEEVIPAQSGEDFWGYSAKAKKKAKKAMVSYNDSGTSTNRRQRTWQNFLSQSRRNPLHGSKPLAYKARPNSEACEDYTEVFISHAKLYVFADTYDVEELRLLSLHKLHQALACFTLYQGRVADIASLLQYTYQNTAEREDGIDDLRALVVSYVCCFVERLLDDEMFRATIKAENAAGIDIMEQLRQRLD